MRKTFMAALLAASVLTPGAAWADDHDNRIERVRERGERPDRGGERNERRAERPQRAERAQGGEDTRQRVVEQRGERGDNGVRWIGRRDREQIEQRVAAQPPRIDAPQSIEPRRERRDRQGGFVGTVVEMGREQNDGERVADRDRRDGGWREGRGDWQSNDRNRDRTDWRSRTRYADGDRRWSGDWRSDRRYDWRRHRDRNRTIFRVGRYYDPYGHGYRRFSIGFSLWPSYYRSSYWLDDPWMYRLPPVYGPYRWVRYYDDALLVNIYSGQVVDAIHGFFWSSHGW